MYKADPTGAAKPGLSEHNGGFAVDLYVRDDQGKVVRDEKQLLKLRTLANQHGFVFEYDKDFPHFFYLDAYYPGLTQMLRDREIDPNDYHVVTDVINGIHNQYLDMGLRTDRYATDEEEISTWDFYHSSIFIDYEHANKSRFENLMEATRRLNKLIIPAGKTVDIASIVLGDLSGYSYGYVVGGSVLPAGGVCGLASALGGAANIAGIEWYSEHHHPPTMHAPGGFYQNLPNGSFISYRTTKGEYVIKKYTLTNPHPFDFQISLSADFTPDSVKKMKGGWNTLMNPYRHIGKRAFAFNVQLLPVAPRYNRQYIDSIESPYPDETSHRH